MTIYSHSDKETEKAGFELADHLHPGAVIAMHGGLGVGKTAFIRGLAAGLGFQGHVTSPTFTIVNEYPGSIPLFHFDMYRLSGSDDLFDIGWEDYLQRGGVCAVEWSEITEDAFPDNTISVTIEKIDDTNRIIIINIPGGDTL